MVQQIDFLPASYHQSRQRRQRRILVRGVLLACMGLIAVAILQQHHARGRLTERRDELQSQARRMVQHLDGAEALRQRIDHLEARANLVTTLRIQARPTRILAAVTEALPPFVSITEFSLASEAVESVAAPVQSSDKAAKETAERLTSEQRDLERLTRQNQRTAPFVSIKGIAPNDVAISDYLAALMATRTFDDVKLLYTDKHRHREHMLRSFSIRLRVRKPGTGHAALAALAGETER